MNSASGSGGTIRNKSEEFGVTGCGKHPAPLIINYIRGRKMTANSIAQSERQRLSQKKYRQANKEKIREYQKAYCNSREGLVTKIYNNQKQTSKRRKHPLPSYSREELVAWVLSRPKFETLYQNWVRSGFDRMQVPSCDRLDDYRPYALDNLRLVAWAENHARSMTDKKSGINTKDCKAVVQLTKERTVVAKYHSINHASRVTGAHQSHVSGCCRGKRKSAGGFVWAFAGQVDDMNLCDEVAP